MRVLASDSGAVFTAPTTNWRSRQPLQRASHGHRWRLHTARRPPFPQDQIFLMNQKIDSSSLADLVARLVEAAKRAGADASDAVAVRSRSTSVSVRLGKVEDTEAAESDDVSLRVFLGNRTASVSAN